jgi:hypothetical protein
VFARELLAIGPWHTPAALRRAHQRGVLVEHEHWDWLGGLRIYYVERILPGLFAKEGARNNAEAAEEAERLRGVLRGLTSRSAPS